MSTQCRVSNLPHRKATCQDVLSAPFNRVVSGGIVNLARRGFLKRTGLALMTGMIGASFPFHRNMPTGFIPAALARENGLIGKDGLTLLSDRPLNAETPPELLDDAITPTRRHFIRNNGIPPGMWIRIPGR